MHGHTPLIAMRLKGSAPACVFIDTDAPGPLDPARGWEIDNAAHAHIQTAAGERINRLDLRCVVGLRVHVDGTQKSRVHAMRNACIAAGAVRVIATTLERFGGGENIAFRVIETTDTDGVFVFPFVELMELN